MYSIHIPMYTHICEYIPSNHGQYLQHNRSSLMLLWDIECQLLISAAIYMTTEICEPNKIQREANVIC